MDKLEAKWRLSMMQFYLSLYFYLKLLETILRSCIYIRWGVYTICSVIQPGFRRATCTISYKRIYTSQNCIVNFICSKISPDFSLQTAVRTAMNCSCPVISHHNQILWLSGHHWHWISEDLCDSFLNAKRTPCNLQVPLYARMVFFQVPMRFYTLSLNIILHKVWSSNLYGHLELPMQNPTNAFA